LGSYKSKEDFMTSLHADDAFLSYYQFSHDPFTPRVPGFKFYPAQRKSVLGQLHHLARYGQLLLLVTGPKGSGKTLLRQALVASTNKQSVQSLVLSGKECSTAADVLAQTARGVEASSASLAAILARAGQLALTGQEEYLLVDDAGLLEDQALEALLALAAGNGEGRLHVFLFGEASLAERLDSLSPDAEGFHRIELQPYTDTETREYLAQRLEGAGQAIDLLTDEQIEDIHVQSGGWPGAINLVAREMLVDAMLADRGESNSRGFSFRLPRKHLLALTVACVAVIGVWFMNNEKPQSQQAVSLPAGEHQPAEANTSDSAVEFSSGSSTQSQSANPVIREPLALASGEADADESGEMTSQTDTGESISAADADALASVPLPLPAKPMEAGSIPVDAQSTQTAPVPDSAASSLPVQPSAAEKVEPPPVVKPVEKAVTPAVSAVKSVTPAVPVGTAWYSAQSPERFALQVLGTRSEDSARALVKQNGNEYHYYVKAHQGGNLYVVTYGVFSSRAAADAALKTLPAKLQAGKPWAKTFRSIQQEMLKGR